MNRKPLSVILLVALVVFGGLGAGRAYDMNSVLQQHDPRTDVNTESSSPVQAAQASSVPASQAVSLSSERFADIIDRLNRILDKMTRLLEEMIAQISSKEKSAKTKAKAKTKPKSESKPDSGDKDNSPSGQAGSVQQKVVAEARKLVGNRNFPYASGTNGGRLGCAQVVSTALKSAGVLSRVTLGVHSVVGDLHARGWKDVKVPPFQAGDVICWSTYDTNGDGRNDPDTHIGIIMGSGNSVQAMSNSSSQLMPRLTSANYQPITRVLRKA